MKVKDKVFVVTGGGNGVGRELVLGLLARGARVAAVDINPQALKETADLSGENQGRLSTHVVDVADRAAVDALPNLVVAQHGAVDGIVNNAGIIHPFRDVSETGYDTAKRVMDINFTGTFYMTRAFLPHLLARPQAHITNVSSMGALFPVPGQTIYGASKAGVKILTEGLCSELENTRVRVMVVFPGGINSNIMGNSGVTTSPRVEQLRKVIKLLSPRQAANIIIDGIERNRRRLTPGVDATLIDFACRMSPNLAPRLVFRIMRSILQ